MQSYDIDPGNYRWPNMGKHKREHIQTSSSTQIPPTECLGSQYLLLPFPVMSSRDKYLDRYLSNEIILKGKWIKKCRYCHTDHNMLASVQQRCLSMQWKLICILFILFMCYLPQMHQNYLYNSSPIQGIHNSALQFEVLRTFTYSCVYQQLW